MGFRKKKASKHDSIPAKTKKVVVLVRKIQAKKAKAVAARKKGMKGSADKVDQHNQCSEVILQKLFLNLFKLKRN
jgi:hypothetical protein